jgi:hypothetical protein
MDSSLAPLNQGALTANDPVASFHLAITVSPTGRTGEVSLLTATDYSQRYKKRN